MTTGDNLTPRGLVDLTSNKDQFEYDYSLPVAYEAHATQTPSPFVTDSPDFYAKLGAQNITKYDNHLIKSAIANPKSLTNSLGDTNSGIDWMEMATGIGVGLAGGVAGFLVGGPVGANLGAVGASSAYQYYSGVKQKEKDGVENPYAINLEEGAKLGVGAAVGLSPLGLAKFLPKGGSGLIGQGINLIKNISSKATGLTPTNIADDIIAGVGVGAAQQTAETGINEHRLPTIQEYGINAGIGAAIPAIAHGAQALAGQAPAPTMLPARPATLDGGIPSAPKSGSPDSVATYQALNPGANRAPAALPAAPMSELPALPAAPRNGIEMPAAPTMKSLPPATPAEPIVTPDLLLNPDQTVEAAVLAKQLDPKIEAIGGKPVIDAQLESVNNELSTIQSNPELQKQVGEIKKAPVEKSDTGTAVKEHPDFAQAENLLGYLDKLGQQKQYLEGQKVSLDALNRLQVSEMGHQQDPMTKNFMVGYIRSLQDKDFFDFSVKANEVIQSDLRKKGTRATVLDDIKDMVFKPGKVKGDVGSLTATVHEGIPSAHTALLANWYAKNRGGMSSPVTAIKAIIDDFSQNGGAWMFDTDFALSDSGKMGGYFTKDNKRVPDHIIRSVHQRTKEAYGDTFPQIDKHEFNHLLNFRELATDSEIKGYYPLLAKKDLGQTGYGFTKEDMADPKAFIRMFLDELNSEKSANEKNGNWGMFEGLRKQMTTSEQKQFDIYHKQVSKNVALRNTKLMKVTDLPPHVEEGVQLLNTIFEENPKLNKDIGNLLVAMDSNSDIIGDIYASKQNEVSPIGDLTPGDFQKVKNILDKVEDLHNFKNLDANYVREVANSLRDGQGEFTSQDLHDAYVTAYENFRMHPNDPDAAKAYKQIRATQRLMSNDFNGETFANKVVGPDKTLMDVFSHPALETTDNHDGTFTVKIKGFDPAAEKLYAPKAPVHASSEEFASVLLSPDKVTKLDAALDSFPGPSPLSKAEAVEGFEQSTGLKYGDGNPSIPGIATKEQMDNLRHISHSVNGFLNNVADFYHGPAMKSQYDGTRLKFTEVLAMAHNETKHVIKTYRKYNSEINKKVKAGVPPESWSAKELGAYVEMKASTRAADRLAKLEANLSPLERLYQFENLKGENIVKIKDEIHSGSHKFSQIDQAFALEKAVAQPITDKLSAYSEFADTSNTNPVSKLLIKIGDSVFQANLNQHLINLGLSKSPLASSDAYRNANKFFRLAMMDQISTGFSNMMIIGAEGKMSTDAAFARSKAILENVTPVEKLTNSDYQLLKEFGVNDIADDVWGMDEARTEFDISTDNPFAEGRVQSGLLEKAARLPVAGNLAVASMVRKGAAARALQLAKAKHKFLEGTPGNQFALEGLFKEEYARQLENSGEASRALLTSPLVGAKAALDTSTYFNILNTALDSLPEGIAVPSKLLVNNVVRRYTGWFNEEIAKQSLLLKNTFDAAKYSKDRAGALRAGANTLSQISMSMGLLGVKWFAPIGMLSAAMGVMEAMQGGDPEKLKRSFDKLNIFNLIARPLTGKDYGDMDLGKFSASPTDYLGQIANNIADVAKTTSDAVSLVKGKPQATSYTAKTIKNTGARLGDMLTAFEDVFSGKVTSYDDIALRLGQAAVHMVGLSSMANQAIKATAASEGFVIHNKYSSWKDIIDTGFSGVGDTRAPYERAHQWDAASYKFYQFLYTLMGAQDHSARDWQTQQYSQDQMALESISNQLGKI